VLGAFLRSQGVKPAFSVRAADGAFLPRTVVCLRDGASRYVGIQRGYKIADPSPRTFDIVGPGKAHIYDVREGRYLGRGDRTQRKLQVARGALVAFLPYKAEGISLQGLPSDCRQGDRLKLRLTLETEGDEPDGGVFRVETRDPSGRRVPALSSKVRATRGRADLVLQMAHNDPVGNWALSVTDIATGVCAKATFTVK
jgi:hypothetical protein